MAAASPSAATSHAKLDQVIAAMYRGRSSGRDRGHSRGDKQQTHISDGKVTCYLCGRANYIATYCRYPRTYETDRWQRDH